MSPFAQQLLEDCSYTCGLRRLNQPPIKTMDELKTALIHTYVVPVVVFAGIGGIFLAAIISIAKIMVKYSA